MLKGSCFYCPKINEINIQAIQEVATDIGGLLVYMSNIRGKTTKIQNLIEKHKKDIDEDLDEIKAAVGRHQKKLMAAVSGLANGEMETGVAPQQVKPVRIR